MTYLALSVHLNVTVYDLRNCRASYGVILEVVGITVVNVSGCIDSTSEGNRLIFVMVNAALSEDSGVSSIPAAPQGPNLIFSKVITDLLTRIPVE